MSDERRDDPEATLRPGPAEPEEKGLAMPDENPEIEIISIGDEDVDPADPVEDDDAPAGGDSPSAAAEAQERYLRLRADFENFRKRVERDRGEQARRALFAPMSELLPVVDNLERALGTQSEGADFRQGVELIHRQLLETLRRFGLSEIPADGLPFDPRVHEAVAREESREVDRPTVIDELQRGYWLNERLLRPAMVRVAVPADDAPADPVQAGSDSETVEET